MSLPPWGGGVSPWADYVFPLRDGARAYVLRGGRALLSFCGERVACVLLPCTRRHLSSYAVGRVGGVLVTRVRVRACEGVLNLCGLQRDCLNEGERVSMYVREGDIGYLRGEFARGVREGIEKRAGVYREGGTFTHEGVEYDLDSALRASERSPVRRVPLSRLEWVLAYDTPDPSRVSAADVRAPLLVTRAGDGRLTVVDGLHRLTKLKRGGAKYAPTRYVPRGELEKVAMGFGWSGRGARAAGISF